MARLASDANLNYEPLHNDAAALIASFIAPNPFARALDPCAGEGRAIGILCTLLGIVPSQRYLNEYHDERAAPASKHTANVVHQADAITDLRFAKHGAGLVYCNPPFTHQMKMLGGGRVEQLFFQRLTQPMHAWIQPSGVAVLVAKQQQFARKNTTEHLATCYDDLRAYALPEHLAKYGEVVVFGVRRSYNRAGGELASMRATLADLFAGELPILAAQDQPLYALPNALAIAPFTWRNQQNATPMEGLADVVVTGGAWNDAAYKRRADHARMRAAQLRPLAPLSLTQAALRAASGGIDGQVVPIAGRELLMKGTTVPGQHTWTTERPTADGKGTVTETHTIERPVPHLVTIDTENGNVGQFVGDQGLATLMGNATAANAIIEAVSASAPPLYQMEMPTNVTAILDRLVPVSGRHLPGYAPGLIPMQRHLAAAMQRGFASYRNVGLAVDMGGGKTSMAMAVAELMRCLKPTNKGRAYTALVMAPSHLVSQENWLGEWADLLPGWAIYTLESPYQVRRFFDGAAADPTTPRVGFLTIPAARDASGRTNAVVAKREAPYKKDALYTDTLNQMRQENEQDRARSFAARDHKTRLAGKKADDLPTLEYNDEIAKRGVSEVQYLSQVSLRTIYRDRVLRAGHAGRRTTAMYRYGCLTCPDCGRVATTPKGAAHSERSLFTAGITYCRACGAALGALSRKQDSVPDRLLPVWQDMGKAHPDVPWGKRPESNPRYPLGELIARRYAGLVDLFISDEAHKSKGANTEIGRIFGMLVNSCLHTLALTGTPYGGKASSLFKLLMRMGNRELWKLYTWDDESAFVRELGIVETIEREYTYENEASTMRGKNGGTSTTTRERAGITPQLAAITQSQMAIVLLNHMGFQMPEYNEEAVLLSLPDDVQGAYNALRDRGKAIVRKGPDAMGSYLQATLTMPMAPWHTYTISSKKAALSTSSLPFDHDTVLPHHVWLAEYIVDQIRQGRRVLSFVEHTGKLDIMPDLVRKVCELGGMEIRPAILRSSTLPKTSQRAAWFKQQEANGVNWVLCHPQLVETGLNLIGWPSLVFIEPGYNTYVAMQARKRSYRPTQTLPVEVHWLGYRDTMIAQALDVIGQKAAAAGLLAGDRLDGGLFQVDASMSLYQELAERVRSDTQVYTADISAKMAAATVQMRESYRRAQLAGVNEQALAPVVRKLSALDRARALLRERRAQQVEVAA